MRNFDYLYEPDDYYQKLYCKDERDKPLSFDVIRNGVLLPFKRMAGTLGGGIVDESGMYLENTSIHTKAGLGYDYSDVNVRESTETVIYMGMMVNIWGHCLTDNIRRMWFLLTDEYKDKFSNYKVIYIPMDNFEFGMNFQMLLSILGVDFRQFVPVSEVTRYNEIIIPNECFFTLDGSTRYFTDEYVNMIEKIKEYGLNHFTKLPYDKVYYTYMGYASTKQLGEEKLEKFFHKQGYKIIAPEKYSFIDQLNIMLNCRSFASTIGSCSHNIMFMESGADVILIPRANYYTGYQLAIDDVTDLNINYVSSDLSILVDQNFRWRGPFYYYISENLLDFFKCRKNVGNKFWKRNLKDFKLYLRMGETENNNLENCNYPFYYQNILLHIFKLYNKSSKWIQFTRKFKIIKVYVYIRNKGINGIHYLTGVIKSMYIRRK